MYMSECMFIFLDFNQTLILSFFLFGGGIVGWLPLENIFTPRESLIKKIHSRKVTFKCHFLPQLRNLQFYKGHSVPCMAQTFQSTLKTNLWDASFFNLHLG